MRKLSFFYFLPSDLKCMMNKHRKELLLLLSLFLFGLILGIVIAVNASSEYVGSFTLIISNEFSPMRSFWIYSAILFFSILCCFLSGWKRGFGLFLLAVTFFLGYVFGRIACFSVLENTFWGILSILIFVLPNAILLLFSIYFTFCQMQEMCISGLGLKRNAKQIKGCLKFFLLGVGVLFVINVIIGGVINLLVNIV